MILGLRPAGREGNNHVPRVLSAFAKIRTSERFRQHDRWRRMPDTGILQAERMRQAGCQFVSIALGRMVDRRPAHDLD